MHGIQRGEGEGSDDAEANGGAVCEVPDALWILRVLGVPVWGAGSAGGGAESGRVVVP